MIKPNWTNRTIWTGDNLDIMRGMNSESVDLIYLDPPYNSNRTYSAPIGSEAAGAAFKDTWTLDDVDLAWHGEIAEHNQTLYAIIDAAGFAHGKGMKSYLIMMAVRLMEMKRILKETGSIYLHCDPTASHYLKTLMDVVFGKENFKNEIIWCYKSGGASKRQFAKKHDVLFFYAKNDKTCKFNPLKIKSYGQSGGGQGGAVKYFKDKKGTYSVVTARDWWEISMLSTTHGERVGYPTQKPLALLDRIIKASTNEGDVVFDPFCGCATACVAAEHLQRNWIGIDLSPMASKLVNSRLKKDMGLFFDIAHRTDIPTRSDLGKLPPYRTHKHTLYGKQEGICNGCLASFNFRNFTVDHIIPQAKGGSDHLDNLQLLCGACNSSKGTRTHEEFIAKLIELKIRTK